MTTAMWLLVYSAALTWLGPALLTWITRGGHSPRLAIAAWLTALSAALGGWTVALILVAVAAVHGLRDSAAVTLCLELFGLSQHSRMPGRLGALAVIAVGATVSIVMAVKVFRTLNRLRSRSRAHAETAWLIGRRTDRPDVVILDASHPAAYCVTGRPDAIVVTSAALAALDSSALAAVLAHEDAHLRGRHHQLLSVLRALSTTVPAAPLLHRAESAVAELLEMCADDAAARRHGTPPLLEGLLILSDRQPPISGALAAAASAVEVRAMRLLSPPQSRTRVRYRVLLIAAMAATVSAPAAINLLCHH
ncbi:MAG: M56 family metallopeptidase [Mycobacterium sp.]